MATKNSSVSRDFADYCCELLASAGPCVARRMFGGWGLSIGGLTLAIIADLGEGERLYLKADAATRAAFEAAGCAQFVYLAKGKPMAMNYYTAPDDAMESAALMQPWARRALDAALKASAGRTRTKVPAFKPRPAGTPARRRPATGT